MKWQVQVNTPFASLAEFVLKATSSYHGKFSSHDPLFCTKQAYDIHTHITLYTCIQIWVRWTLKVLKAYSLKREMREMPHSFILQLTVVLFHCSVACSYSLGLNHDTVQSHVISPRDDPRPFLPLIAPSPLTPFTNNGVPKLSGLCTLDFSAHESLLNTTATDCWGSFAPYLSNAICCPQFKATLTTLIGNSSKYSGELALNSTVAKHCLLDIDQILRSKGAIENLHEMCSISHFNLTQGSCPVINTNEINQLLDYSKIMAKCRKIDVVNECCTRGCQMEISIAALKIVNLSSGGTGFKSKLDMIKDCESVVLRWITTKLDPVSMNGLLRGISTCEINKACPLVLSDTTNVSENCRNTTNNKAACCNAMENYVSLLQEQTLVTNLQALKCAELLGITLQKANVTRDVYDLCRIKLNDFTLQVFDSISPLDVTAGTPISSQGPGCLLPSLPSDATYDNTYGISFVCDLNDNLAAPWPSNSSSPASSCDDSTVLPALPKATSAGTGVDVARLAFPLVMLTLLSFV